MKTFSWESSRSNRLTLRLTMLNKSSKMKRKGSLQNLARSLTSLSKAIRKQSSHTWTPPYHCHISAPFNRTTIPTKKRRKKTRKTITWCSNLWATPTSSKTPPYQPSRRVQAPLKKYLCSLCSCILTLMSHEIEKWPRKRRSPPSSSETACRTYTTSISMSKTSQVLL